MARYLNGLASGKSLSDDPAAAAAANPVNYVSASAPPFLLFHGSADNLVSPSQTLIVSFLRHYEEPQRPDTTCC